MKAATVPLRDQFLTDDRREWQGVHSLWISMILLHLEKKVPSRYQLIPNVHLGRHYELDVAAFETDVLYDQQDSHATLATLAPPECLTDIEHDFWDIYEVNITDTAANRLVAVIELVGPANKDRPDSRAAFVSKCAAFLQQDVSVTIVDLVYRSQFNLYTELMDELRMTDRIMSASPPSSYAVAIRDRDHPIRHKRRKFESWPYALHIGQPLPALPIWLANDEWVMLDLESTHDETCKSLRLR